ARKRRLPDLEVWYRNRALLAAAAAGLISISGLAIVRADAPRLFHRLLGPGLPFVGLSVVTGLGVLGLLRLADPRILRALAAATTLHGPGPSPPTAPGLRAGEQRRRHDDVLLMARPAMGSNVAASSIASSSALGLSGRRSTMLCWCRPMNTLPGTRSKRVRLL